jgi:hypothetical protein
LQREFEPLISNYPMYAESFHINSNKEKEDWARFTRIGRHFIYDIDVLDDKEIASLGASYRLARVLSDLGPLGRSVLGRYPIRSLDASGTWRRAAKGEPISSAQCESFRGFMTKTGLSGAKALRLSRRYYELTDGVLHWVPVERSLVIDLDASDCEYAFRGPEEYNLDRVEARADSARSE